MPSNRAKDKNNLEGRSPMTINMLKLLDPAIVSLNLTVTSATEVISHLGQQLFKTGYVRNTFVEAALAREQELPTGLPLNGHINAAIPHTDVEHVLKPGVAMATLTTPVVFKNMAKPQESVLVQLIFLLALNQPKAQIEMLQEIAGILQQPMIVSRLMAANDFQDVKKVLAAP
jgi:PTS system galactitol-specific IIA component